MIWLLYLSFFVCVFFFLNFLLLRIGCRLPGLDPAGPLFESQDPRARLDETDATFVDVIHSNGEQLILGGLGSWQPMGDVDFYPNGGRMQTGCSNLFVGAVSDIIWSEFQSLS